AAGPAVAGVPVLDRVVARGQLPQAAVHLRRTEHAGGGLVGLVPAVEQPAALQVPGHDVLVQPRGLAERGTRVLALEEQRAEGTGRLQPVGPDAVAAGAGRGGDGQRWTA